jgi:cytochrome c oxidase assembly protein subunit 15
MSVTAVRARTVAGRTFLRLSVASAVVFFLVVTSGAFVRLTGSGLGCENWPRCGDKPYPEQGYHAFIEFGNRMVALAGILLSLTTWLASRRVVGLSRVGQGAALAAFLVAAAQIPMGGITIALDLHPLAVMAHFLLGLTVVALALVVVIEALGLVEGFAAPAGSRLLRQVVTFLGVPACAALVVTGAVATASGPHPGASEDVRRLGIGITDTVYVHVRVAAAFGLGVLVVGVLLWRLRESYPGLARLWVLLVGVLVAQAILGEVQYRNALPWGLVLLHVFLATCIWGATSAVAYVLWRPPLALTRRPDRRQ